MSKRKPVIAVTKTADSVTFTCVNGESRQVRLSDLTDETRDYAAVHGLTQKAVDSAAMSRNPETGKPATAEEKWTAVCEVIDRLTSGGPWNVAREGVGSGGLLFAALCEMFDGRKTPAEVREWLDGKTPAEKTALRANARVAEIVRRLEAERAERSGVDSDGILAELE